MMDKKYRELFAALAQFSEVIAEKVMESQKKESNFAEYKKASDMREAYRNLGENIKKEEYEMTEKDATFFILGAQAYIKHMNSIIEKQKSVVSGYESDIIPKLVEYTKTKNSNIFSIPID